MNPDSTSNLNDLYDHLRRRGVTLLPEDYLLAKVMDLKQVKWRSPRKDLRPEHEKLEEAKVWHGHFLHMMAAPLDSCPASIYRRMKAIYAIEESAWIIKDDTIAKAFGIKGPDISSLSGAKRHQMSAKKLAKAARHRGLPYRWLRDGECHLHYWNRIAVGDSPLDLDRRYVVRDEGQLPPILYDFHLAVLDTRSILDKINRFKSLDDGMPLWKASNEAMLRKFLYVMDAAPQSGDSLEELVMWAKYFKVVATINREIGEELEQLGRKVIFQSPSSGNPSEHSYQLRPNAGADLGPGRINVAFSRAELDLLLEQFGFGWIDTHFSPWDPRAGLFPGIEMRMQEARQKLD